MSRLCCIAFAFLAMCGPIAALADPITFAVHLRMRDLPGLQARVARGEIIPRAELEARYLPLASDYAAAAEWLTSQGVAIKEADPARLGIFGEASTAQVQTLRRARLAASVLGMEGLGAPHLRQPLIRETSASGSAPYLPRDLMKAYNGASLAVKGTTLTGAGETIAVVIDAPPSTADLTQFWSAAGVSQSLSNCAFIQVNGGTPGPANPETALDAEWTSGIAPGAKLRVYCAGALDDVSLDRCLQRILADLPANPSIHQVSISLGAGETFTGPTQLEADAQYFAALASQGVSVFVASGDGGSTPDDLPTGPGNTGPLQVESYASDPSVTGVGGTSLALDSTGARLTETAWAYSGGGVSAYFARPSWQAGSGFRLVPDVCSAADPARGAYVVYGGAVKMYGGTSWGAPVWAGICALINQGRALSGKAPAALLNPSLYPLVSTVSFTDIVSGANSGGARSGGNYAAGPGYDSVTGLGAPNVANLLAALTIPDASSAGVVISQVYGGGGLAGAAFKNDFIEIYNRGNSAVDLSSWSVQYTGKTGNSWLKTNLAGVIKPHGYLLVQEYGNGANVPALPTPDLIGSVDLNVTDGKVALLNVQTVIPTGVKDPTVGGSYGLQDFIGYGQANAAEGSAPAPALSIALSAQRANAGATDTDNNAADFTASYPAPRNSTTPANAPDLIMSLTHSGSFKQGDAADVCTATVTNSGAAPTAGAVSIFAAPPGGLTVIAMSGAGWVIAADQQNATRTDALPAGGSYPPLSITLQVAADALANLVNLARTLGGGEFNASNDAATDPIAIAQMNPSESWRYQYFGATGNTGPGADNVVASGDGLPNLLKYALGLNPKVPAVPGVVVDVENGALYLAVTRNPAATDVQFAVQVSSDLTASSSWTSAGVVIDESTATSLRAHDGSPPAGATGRYIRLQVSRP